MKYVGLAGYPKPKYPEHNRKARYSGGCGGDRKEEYRIVDPSQLKNRFQDVESVHPRIQLSLSNSLSVVDRDLSDLALYRHLSKNFGLNAEALCVQRHPPS